MDLKITSEKVLAGAKKCPQAEGVLKEMFPEAFPASYVKCLPYNAGTNSTPRISLEGGYSLEIRPVGSNLAGSIYLPLITNVEWCIEKDNQGQLCLVGRKK